MDTIYGTLNTSYNFIESNVSDDPMYNLSLRLRNTVKMYKKVKVSLNTFNSFICNGVSRQIPDAVLDAAVNPALLIYMEPFPEGKPDAFIGDLPQHITDSSTNLVNLISGHLLAGSLKFPTRR